MSTVGEVGGQVGEQVGGQELLGQDIVAETLVQQIQALVGVHE